LSRLLQTEDDLDLPENSADLMRLGLEVANEVHLERDMTTPDIEIDPDNEPWLDAEDTHGNPQLWAQQPDESARAYALFRYYCSMPRIERSYVGADRHYGIKPAASKYANKYSWPERVAAWDLERDRIYQSRVLEKLREVGERQGDILGAAIEAVAIVYKPMIDRIENDPEGVSEELAEKSIIQQHGMAMKASRVLPNLMAAERLAVGLPTQITQNVHTGKIEHVHTPDLDAVADILAGLNQAGAFDTDTDRVIDVGEVAGDEAEPLPEDDTDL